jgi:hypothetical protein
MSTVAVNVPEIQEFAQASFTYNYFVKDERVNPFVSTPTMSLEKLPRYVTLSWLRPKLSAFELQKPAGQGYQRSKSVENAFKANKLLYEDDFSPGYLSHVFSDVSTIEQGSSDLENFARINKTNYESVSKMAKEQVSTVANAAQKSDQVQQTNLANISKAFSSLADFPKTSLGLRIFDENGTEQDTSEFLSSVAEDLSFHVQINSSIIPDIFKNSKEKQNKTHFSLFKKSFANNLNLQLKTGDQQAILPMIDLGNSVDPLKPQPVLILGYLIKRYVTTPSGFKRDAVFFIEDSEVTNYVDKTVLYGVTYTYSINVVAAINLLVYDQQLEKSIMGQILIASRPVSKAVECYEYVPPPEPNNLKFTYDYGKNRLIMTWDMPVNPQNDVKQFQVMRRKSIKHPFELIAQYSFDDSIPGSPDNLLFTTGEIVDGNNFNNVAPENRFLVKISKMPVYIHVDEDFSVDVEFATSTSFIYAVCSVDAHGMISNYSTQHHVTFDPYKNRLATSVVCDTGSPRPYPNMNLRMDAFKDVMSFSGDETRHMTVYFTPEYLKVTDEDGRTYRIVEGDAPSKTAKPYYVMQLTNLDNQKSQLVKMNVLDPTNLTV